MYDAYNGPGTSEHLMLAVVPVYFLLCAVIPLVIFSKLYLTRLYVM